MPLQSQCVDMLRAIALMQASHAGLIALTAAEKAFLTDVLDHTVA